MRIVSLLASGTEIVHALGLGDRLVGISHECDYPDALLDRPRVSRPRFDPAGMDSAQVDRAVRQAMAEHGSVYAIDGERLADLEPDLILTQAVCEVCAVPTPGVRDEVARRGLHADVLSLDAHTIDGILETIRQVGAAADARPAAERVASDLRARMSALLARLPAQRPGVLALEWLAPPFAPGHWAPEMVERAGGRCLVGDAGERSRELDWSALEGLDPDVLVLMPCGFEVEQAMRDANAHADELRRVAPRAIAKGRAWVVNGSAYFNRSGPRFIRGIEILAALLHPDHFDPPHPHEAVRWP